MADDAGSSTSWYQWFADTAQNLYAKKMDGDVAKKQAELLAQQNAADNELSFLGQTIHKDTLMWIGGGILLVTLVVLVAKR